MRRMGYEEAAAMAGLSPRKIRYAVYAGDLIARRCGRRVLISEADLDVWLNSMPLVTGGDIDDETELEGDVDRRPARSTTRNHEASAAVVRQVAA